MVDLRGADARADTAEALLLAYAGWMHHPAVLCRLLHAPGRTPLSEVTVPRPLLLALALLASLLFGTGAGEAAGELKMTVRPGLDGVVKLGAWFPVEVLVANVGPDVTGEIQIQVDGVDNRGAFNRPPVIYGAPAVLPRQSNKRFVLEVFLPGPVEKLTAKLVADGNVLAQTDAPIDRLGQGEILCGVLAGNRTMLDFLPGVEMAGRQRRVRLAKLELADLPPSPQLLSSLDCMVVSNVSLAGLPDLQKEALYSWTAAGGLLIVAGGPGWQKTVAGLPKELMPVEVTGTVPLRSARSLEQFFGEPIEDPGPWLAAEARPTDGAVVVAEGGVPLLVAARRGQGAVFFIAFDPSLEPLRSWRGSAQLWRYMIGYVPAQLQMPSNLIRQYPGWGRPPRNAISDLSPFRPPAAETLPWVLLLYALAIGPVSYLALRRLGRLEWSLWLVPLLTAGAVVAAFGTARSGSESDVLFNKITLVRSWDSGADGYSRTYVGAFSPRQGSYDVEIGGRDGPADALVSSLFYPFPAATGTPTPGSGAMRVQRSDTTALKSYELGARALGVFQIDAPVPGDGTVASQLTLGATGLSGTISNKTRGKISNAALVVGQDVVRLGDLVAGETRQVAVPVGEGSPIGYVDFSHAARQLYPDPSVATPVSNAEMMRRDIIDSAFNSSFSFASRVDVSPVSLVGWLERSPLRLQTRNARVAELDRTLMIAGLSVDPQPGEDLTIPTSLIERRNLVAGSGRVTQNAMVVSAGETLLFEYGLPARPDKFVLESIVLDLNGSIPGNVRLADVTQAAVYDWPAAEWRELGLQPGRNPLGDPRRIVSALGQLRLRINYRQTGPQNGTLSFDRFALAVQGRGV